MYQRPIPFDATTAEIGDRCVALRRFVSDHSDGLRNAAGLLAGDRGERLVADICDRLGRETELSRRTWAALRDLLGILTLENVHDERRPEAAFFAAIDPSWPVVEEVCLLTDGYREALEAAIEAQPQSVLVRTVA